MTIKTDSSQPQILIYHTHSQEAYADSTEGDVNTTVVGVGEHLAQILRDEYGYQVHAQYGYLRYGGWSLGQE